jgi:hypothetical protein
MSVLAVRGRITHRLDVDVRRHRHVVTACCAHRGPEDVLAALAGRDLGCEWSSGLLAYLLDRGLGFDQAARWAAHLIKPWRPPGVHRRIAPKEPWSLDDLDHWLELGWSPEAAARFCAVPPLERGGGSS